MIIETTRLRIIQLTAEQFELWLSGVEKMEQSLGLTPSKEHLDEHVQSAMEAQYKKALSDPDNYLWLGNRQIILKSENKSIGSANFKNSPQENSDVEIGYGINADYRNEGYMTEAVQAMCEWALPQSGVNSVIAETDKENDASQKVLKKCGMKKYDESDTGFWWKLEKSKRMNILNTKPEVFKKTEASIWTDLYIQKNLLEAHLNPSSDAASRNKESIETIVDFIDQQIKPKSKILDLGCGPGLYAESLTQKGHTVTGIDFNKKAIEYAVKQNESIEYIEGDYIKNFPHGEYDAIIMIYCDMGTHSDDDRDILLNNCFHSLKEGGKIIFDVFNEDIIKDKQEGSDWEYTSSGGFWAKDEYLLLSQTFHYTESNAFAYQYNLIQGEDIQHFIIWDRYYTQDEITNVLRQVGFKNMCVKHKLLGNNDFTSNNEMFVIAEK
ncbi:RimJ/RimL family protein N-acetyltransferase [Dysgonomonas alginatilytica]|uniref:RimJ/RimL family protein N-acetyltransferase n=1 Tax=Dysgonomonas alginatilytica TaxID=1605892 RepID=A0A2V3PRF2_9BACT|nr:GNAT family N-acetyltransferase [Dysgonomonas alginatilytica]PXV66766.1 RimJ/RimL family protein N-acetyltransferase [Dysgonomonas alginatilytica]